MQDGGQSVELATHGATQCREQSRLGKKDDGLNTDTLNWAVGSAHRVVPQDTSVRAR